MSPVLFKIRMDPYESRHLPFSCSSHKTQLAQHLFSNVSILPGTSYPGTILLALYTSERPPFLFPLYLPVVFRDIIQFKDAHLWGSGQCAIGQRKKKGRSDPRAHSN